MVRVKTLSQPVGEEKTSMNWPTTNKTEIQQGAHINYKRHPQDISSGDQGDCTTESYKTPTTEEHPINKGDKTDQSKM